MALKYQHTLLSRHDFVWSLLEMSFPLLLLLLLLSLLPSTSSLSPMVSVTSSRGIINGFHVDLGSDTSSLFYGRADVFLGIPFAQPPIGDLRFKLPRPICKFDGDLNATEYKPRCPQNQGPHRSEDCLYLNVFTPDAASTTPYPVMVFIHGGTLTNEGADKYAWKGAVRNMVSRGVVVVTLQYRLGLLGFFTTFTSSFPANRGLYDQLLALRWVQEEIGAFGGDAGKVTIFGESAGGSSVSALSLIPQSRGLFHQTIQQSGSILMEYDIPNDPRGSIHKTRAEQICGITDSDWNNNANLDTILLECFNNRTLLELTQHDQKDDLDWTISRDGALLRDSPSSLASSRPPLPAIIGDCKDEYATWIHEVNDRNLSDVGPELMQRDFHKFAPWASADLKAELTSEMTKVFEKKPMKDDDHLGWTQTVSRAYTGLMFSAFMRRDAQWRHEAGTASLFLYTFDHSSRVCVNTEVDGWRPIIHTAELCFLWFYSGHWESAFNHSRITPEDIAVADNFGKAWTDFAKNGNPGWAAATDEYNYVTINEKIEEVQSNWREEEHILYNIVFPDRLGEYPRTTIPKETDEKLKKEGDKWGRLLS